MSCAKDTRLQDRYSLEILAIKVSILNVMATQSCGFDPDNAIYDILRVTCIISLPAVSVIDQSDGDKCIRHVADISLWNTVLPHEASPGTGYIANCLVKQ